MAPLDPNTRSLPYYELSDRTHSHENMEINDLLEEFTNHHVTPPPSPPSPPGPPPPLSPAWNQADFDFHINRIQAQLAELEHKVMGPHIITINGIQNLRPHVKTNWKPKLNRLLFEAKIPYFWILDCAPHPDENYEDADPSDEGLVDDIQQPSRIIMYLLNHHVQIKIFNTLNTYLTEEYNNITYLD